MQPPQPADHVAGPIRPFATAAATAGLGLLLIGGTAVAGKMALSNRRILLRVFRPGLYVTLGAAALLTLAQTTEFIYACYYFEAAYAGGVHIQLLIFLGLGAALTFVAVLRALLFVFKRDPLRVGGKTVSVVDQPRLWSEVESLCRSLSIKPPNNIIVGLAPTFFVTEGEISCLGTRFSGRTLFISLAAARVLSPAELRAVIAHEMAHFHGEDTAFSKRFFPVYKGTWAALFQLEARSRGVAVFTSLPASTFIGFFFLVFARAEKNVSRLREKEADQVAARLAGRDSLGRALLKLHAYGTLWPVLFDGVRYGEDAFVDVRNAAAAFADRAAAMPREQFDKAGSLRVSHPLDSHPTLLERIEAIGMSLSDLVPAAQVPCQSEAASSLLRDAESMEAIQTQVLRDRRGF